MGELHAPKTSAKSSWEVWTAPWRYSCASTGLICKAMCIPQTRLSMSAFCYQNSCLLFVLYQMYCCNCLPSSLTAYWTNFKGLRFQRWKVDHATIATPLLHELHWLPAQAPIDYSNATLVYCCLPRLTIAYLCYRHLSTTVSSVCLFWEKFSKCSFPSQGSLFGILFPFLFRMCLHLKLSEPTSKAIYLRNILHNQEYCST